MKIIWKAFKRELNKVLLWLIQNNGIRALISIIAMTVLIVIISNAQGISTKEMIDFTIFFTVIAVLLLDVTSKFIEKVITNIIEDTRKLSVDYDDLAKRYQGDMITFSNSIENQVEEKNINCLRKTCGIKRKKQTNDAGVEVRFPVSEEVKLFGKKIKIYDTKKMYELPEQIKKYYDELIKAHNTSNIYNQLNIRLNHWEEINNEVHFYTSRTTFYDSLVTNRSMDYVLSNGLTNRDLYGYGPFKKSLKESKLSNHLGFNGFIISVDNCIPFVLRNSMVSIGKRTYGTSIGASLKAKYALDDDLIFKNEGLEKAILEEIKDELKIKNDQIEGFSAENNLITVYRDWVEGGKPQLLFWAKANISKETIKNQFKEETQKKQKNKNIQISKKESKELEDGEELLWIPKMDIQKIAFEQDGFIYEGKEYHMMPSGLASIVMLREFFKLNPNVDE